MTKGVREYRKVWPGTETYAKAWEMYVHGERLVRISRKLDIPIGVLRKYASPRGYPEIGVESWPKHRMRLIQSKLAVTDDAIVESLNYALQMTKNTAAKVYKSVDEHLKKKSATPIEYAAALREFTQVIRLMSDIKKPVPGGNNLNLTVQAGAQINSTSGLTVDGSHASLATIRALQGASDEERRALENYQKRYTLEMEGKQPIAALPDPHAPEGLTDDDFVIAESRPDVVIDVQPEEADDGNF